MLWEVITKSASLGLVLLTVSAHAAPSGPEGLDTKNASANQGTFSHDDWTAVLSKYVDDVGNVDYVALKKDRKVLDRYLDSIRSVSPESRPDLFPTRHHALAYYLNAYNAHTFDGVLEGGGTQSSVWPTLWHGYKFFVGRKIELGGKRTNLKALEDKKIREAFEDPRIHAALVCASISCPRLPQEAFEPDTLDAQLDAVTTEFSTDTKHVRVEHDDKTVHLSKIYDWYADDYLDYEKARGQSKPKLVDYINRYRAADDQIPRDYKVVLIPYDKSLNAQ